MASFSSAGTAYSDGVRVGPMAQSEPDRQAGRYQTYGPGMALASMYSYIFTPFPCPATNSVNYDIAGTFTIAAGSTGAYIPLANVSSWPTANQFTNGLTGLTGIQFDAPRVPSIVNTTAVNGVVGTGVTVTVNFNGLDANGFLMTDVEYMSNTLSANSTTYAIKAFDRMTSVWVGTSDGSAFTGNFTITGVRTTNRFGLPYRLYSVADVVSIGGGQQCLSAAGTGRPASASDPIVCSQAEIMVLVSQSYFQNDIYTYASAFTSPNRPVATGGPLHRGRARDVYGTFYADPTVFGGANGTFTPAEPQTFIINYIVRGFYNTLDLQNEEIVNSQQYDVPFPNAYPILPNVYYNYPAGQYTPTSPQTINRLPINLTDQVGVSQFYSTTPVLTETYPTGGV